MNAIPYARFVVMLCFSAFLYYIFDILIREYMLSNESLSSVTKSGPYPLVMLIWGAFLLIVMVVEAIRLFIAVQRRTGL